MGDARPAYPGTGSVSARAGWNAPVPCVYPRRSLATGNVLGAPEGKARTLAAGSKVIAPARTKAVVQSSNAPIMTTFRGSAEARRSRLIRSKATAPRA